MRLVLAGLILALSSSLATAAGNVAKEVNAYRSIEVNFSENAHKCNLKDGKPFEDQLRKELFKIGVSENQDSMTYVVLAVTGTTFGALSAQCSSQTVLTFQTVLGAENIVVDNPAVRQAIDRLERIPVVFWQSGQFGVQPQTQPAAGGESTTSQEAVVKMITNLVARFNADRQGE